MSANKLWFGRLGTLISMAYLSYARLLVAGAAFERWRDSLGFIPASDGTAWQEDLARAEALARQIVRAASRIPFETKCLHHAMALSWRLRQRRIGHLLVFAVRPADRRHEADMLHAWVEVRGVRIIGDLPGPWIETLALGR